MRTDIDVTFDFRRDTPEGKDPDTYSKSKWGRAKTTLYYNSGIEEAPIFIERISAEFRIGFSA